VHAPGNLSRKLQVQTQKSQIGSVLLSLYDAEPFGSRQNHQCHDFDPECEDSIFFELDGPYKAMILPSSKEESSEIATNRTISNVKSLNFFLLGTTLQECYAAVAQIAGLFYASSCWDM
jgi:hypothetical protein